MTKEKHVYCISDMMEQSLTGYSNSVIPGKQVRILYSDKSEVLCTIAELDVSCADNPLNGMTEVVIRLKLKKEDAE